MQPLDHRGGQRWRVDRADVLLQVMRAAGAGEHHVDARAMTAEAVGCLGQRSGYPLGEEEAQRIGRIEDPVERLRRIGEAYVSFALDHPMHYQLLFMTRRPGVPKEPDAANGDPGEDAYAILRDTCAEVIVSGRLLPEYDDAEELSQMC